MGFIGQYPFVEQFEIGREEMMMGGRAHFERRRRPIDVILAADV